MLNREFIYVFRIIGKFFFKIEPLGKLLNLSKIFNKSSEFLCVDYTVVMHIKM
jgi:hypothetical protein